MLGHPALVLVQARILRPMVLSRRAKCSSARFHRQNFIVAQLGFNFTSQLHVKSATFLSRVTVSKNAVNE